jgi:hypothetical protein
MYWLSRTHLHPIKSEVSTINYQLSTIKRLAPFHVGYRPPTRIGQSRKPIATNTPRLALLIVAAFNLPRYPPPICVLKHTSKNHSKPPNANNRSSLAKYNSSPRNLPIISRSCPGDAPTSEASGPVNCDSH